MAIDDLVKINDARLKSAQTQAQIADTMAAVATKIAQLGLIHEQTIAARLQNIAKFLDIEWDAQAHKSLLKARNTALQKAKKAESEAARADRFAKRLNTLLSGGASITAIRDAWIAFEFFRKTMPVSALITISKIPVESATYVAKSWVHGQKPATLDAPDEQRDIGSALNWARIHNFIPRMGQPAWDVLASYIEAMSASVAAEAAELEARADAALKDAREIAEIDWDRLKTKDS